MLAFPGGTVDVSRFVASHDGPTPTTVTTVSGPWIVAPDELGRERAQRVIVVPFERGKLRGFRAELEFNARKFAEARGPDSAIDKLQESLT